MEEERKVTDLLRDSIMEYVNGVGDGDDLKKLSEIETLIEEIETIIEDTEKKKDVYQKWYYEEKRLTDAIKKGH